MEKKVRFFLNLVRGGRKRGLTSHAWIPQVQTAGEKQAPAGSMAILQDTPIREGDARGRGEVIKTSEIGELGELNRAEEEENKLGEANSSNLASMEGIEGMEEGEDVYRQLSTRRP